MTAMQTPPAVQAPDPVNDARAYQQMLLSALGDDDPAEVQAQTPADARALFDLAGPDLRTRPAPREWSVLLCVAHMTDGEIVMSARYRWVLAHDEPELIGYDQDLWADRLHEDQDPEELLAHFTALRRANVALWRRSSAADRARVGQHRERGPESYDLMFRLGAGHDRVHMAQARRALEAVRA
jgi:DinB superfamily